MVSGSGCTDLPPLAPFVFVPSVELLFRVAEDFVLWVVLGGWTGLVGIHMDALSFKGLIEDVWDVGERGFVDSCSILGFGGVSGFLGAEEGGGARPGSVPPGSFL